MAIGLFGSSAVAARSQCLAQPIKRLAPGGLKRGSVKQSELHNSLPTGKNVGDTRQKVKSENPSDQVGNGEPSVIPYGPPQG
jgi:hypothetical protein